MPVSLRGGLHNPQEGTGLFFWQDHLVTQSRWARSLQNRPNSRGSSVRVDVANGYPASLCDIGIFRNQRFWLSLSRFESWPGSSNRRALRKTLMALSLSRQQDQLHLPWEIGGTIPQAITLRLLRLWLPVERRAAVLLVAGSPSRHGWQDA